MEWALRHQVAQVWHRHLGAVSSDEGCPADIALFARTDRKRAAPWPASSRVASARCRWCSWLACRLEIEPGIIEHASPTA